VRRRCSRRHLGMAAIPVVMGVAPTAVPFDAPMKTCSACVACHFRKLKCVIPPGSQSCQSCIDRGIYCERRIARKRGRPRLHTRPYQTPWVQHAPSTMPAVPTMMCHTVVVGSPASVYPPPAYLGPPVCRSAQPGYATAGTAASHAMVPAAYWPADPAMLPAHYVPAPRYAHPTAHPTVHPTAHVQSQRPPPPGVIYDASAAAGGAPPPYVPRAPTQASAHELASLPGPFSTGAAQPPFSHAASANPAANTLVSLRLGHMAHVPSEGSEEAA